MLPAAAACACHTLLTADAPSVPEQRAPRGAQIVIERWQDTDHLRQENLSLQRSCSSSSTRLTRCSTVASRPTSGSRLRAGPARPRSFPHAARLGRRIAAPRPGRDRCGRRRRTRATGSARRLRRIEAAARLDACGTPRSARQRVGHRLRPHQARSEEARGTPFGARLSDGRTAATQPERARGSWPISLAPYPARDQRRGAD